MRDPDGKIELLAPAGSYETLCAVIEAGCDAVYIGGPRFGARAYADNPDEELLLRGIGHAHMRGVKVYLTVNTVLKQTELGELDSYLLPFYEAGLDAVIVQDFGVMKRIAEHFPGLPIHASTQMTLTDAAAASVLPPEVTRIVPARELSLEEIAKFSAESGRETEIFVHGALCYCYSGQCLLSSMIGGRSGNRGRCAQPCRKRYRYEEKDAGEGYWLSPKDQCLLPQLGELLDTGIESLKIEGRMKRPEYAAGVTAVYRRWLDRYEELGSKAYAEYVKDHPQEMAEDVALLAELYNRGGFCGGYAFDKKGSTMMATDRPNHTGLRVGTAKVTGGVRPTAAATYTAEIGPEEVLEFRTGDGFVCGEVTTPKDMSRWDPSKPVLLRWDAGSGKLPRRVEIYRMRQETLLAEIRETFLEKQRDLPVCGRFTAKAGEPIRFTVTDEDGRACVTVEGEIPQAAVQSATDAEQVLAKLRRTGGSGYAWDQLSADIGDGLFLPASWLNEIRREALQAYEEAVLRTRFRSVPKALRDEAEDATPSEEDTVISGEDKDTGIATDVEAPSEEPLRCAVSVMTPEQTEAALRGEKVTDLFVDMEGAYDACIHIVRAERGFQAAEHIAVSIALPRVCKGERRIQMLSEVERLLGDPLIEGIVVRTPDQLAEIPKWRTIRPELTVHADDTLYMTNEQAGIFLRECGIDHPSVQAELRRSEITGGLAAGSWITVYGRCPLMISEQCPHRTVHGSGSCGKNAEGTLRDEEGNSMPVRSVCRYCHSILYNAHVTSLLTVMEEVLQKRPYGLRVNCSTETRRETELVLRTLGEALAGAVTAEPFSGVPFTKGHWRRGVE